MNFTDRASKSLSDAMAVAEQYAHPQLLPLHLALCLLDPPPDESKDQQATVNASHGSASQSLFRQVVERAHGDPQSFQRALQKGVVRLPSQNPPPEQIAMAPAFLKVLRAAQELQRTQKDSYIAVDHLIMALAQDASVQAALKEGNIPNPKVLQDAVQQIRGTRRVDSKTADAEEEHENLKKFTVDMTALAREGKMDPVIGREEEIRRVVRILSRRTKNNPVLIGDPGVGKTTVVEGLAQRIVNLDVPDNLAACKLLSLDVSSIVAGSKYRGEFEERMKGILKEIEETKEMIVLFVDEMHLLMGAGSSGEGGMDAANMLKPMLARGQLHCIGATTLAEYRKYIEKDAAFERRFQQVLVKEPTVSETISILRGLKERFEVHHGVNISDGAIVAAAELAARYLTQRRLPDSAVDLIDEAAAAVRVARESQPEILDSLDRKLRQLKIEIHLRTGNCAMEEFERQLEDAAAGKAILNDRRFRVFVPEKVKGPASHEWVVHPKDLGDVDEEDLKAIVRAPSTNEWFPARKAVNAEEEGQHRAKRMRANEEEETLGAEKAQEEKAPEAEAEAEGEEEVVGAEEGDHWSDLTIDLDLPDDGLPLLFWDEE